MTGCDRLWHAGGGALYGAGIGIGLCGPAFGVPGDSAVASLLVVIGIAVAIAGLPVLIQGRRVGVMSQARLRRRPHRSAARPTEPRSRS